MTRPQVVSGPAATMTILATGLGASIFYRSASAHSGVSEDRARDALQTTHGSTAGANVLDPQRAREVVDGVRASMIEAIHALGWMLTAVPLAAIVAALILMRPARA